MPWGQLVYLITAVPWQVSGGSSNALSRDLRLTCTCRACRASLPGATKLSQAQGTNSSSTSSAWHRCRAMGSRPGGASKFLKCLVDFEAWENFISEFAVSFLFVTSVLSKFHWGLMENAKVAHGKFKVLSNTFAWKPPLAGSQFSCGKASDPTCAKYSTHVPKYQPIKLPKRS